MGQRHVPVTGPCKREALLGNRAFDTGADTLCVVMTCNAGKKKTQREDETGGTRDDKENVFLKEG